MVRFLRSPAVWPLIRWHEHISAHRQDYLDARHTLSRLLEEAVGVAPGCSDTFPERENEGLKARLVSSSYGSAEARREQLRSALAPGVLDSYHLPEPAARGRK